VTTTRVLGVDACRAGWVGVAWSSGATSAFVAADIGRIVALATADGPVGVIAIDIPVGLADDTPRQADLLARNAAGPRWASVFITPVRPALLIENYAEASALNRRLTGAGISRQAYNLRDKILEVDDWLRRAPGRVVEAHPELTFGEMAGAPLADSKSTWAGAVRRRRLLVDAGFDVSGDLGLTGHQVGVDDVLDAAAVAWTAARVACGAARCIPDPPEEFSDGVAAAIWT
jgi:predicted RNase H-like nuclease